MGTLTHRRYQPDREFRHGLAMAYVDLQELPDLLGGRLMRTSPGLLRFRRSDYHGDPAVALGEAVRDTVARVTEARPMGPIRMLTNLRALGHCFNPVTFYYCFDGSGDRLEAVMAEVTNTPWGERHAYVLPGGAGHFDKQLHVSPFMPMDQVYGARATTPSQRVSVTIESHQVGIGTDQAGRRAFAATLLMDRVELTPAAVRATSLRYPFATVRTLALIYGHALGLRLSGVRPFAHPQGGSA